jgi:hypothetical protein
LPKKFWKNKGSRFSYPDLNFEKLYFFNFSVQKPLAILAPIWIELFWENSLRNYKKTKNKLCILLFFFWFSLPDQQKFSRTLFDFLVISLECWNLFPVLEKIWQNGRNLTRHNEWDNLYLLRYDSIRPLVLSDERKVLLNKTRLFSLRRYSPFTRREWLTVLYFLFRWWREL